MLEDFIRWQSPQEWSENHKSAGSDGDTQNIETGRLSDHVVKPENLWRNIWDNVGTHTPSDQRPLFDYTLEAEKVVASSFLFFPSSEFPLDGVFMI